MMPIRHENYEERRQNNEKRRERYSRAITQRAALRKKGKNRIKNSVKNIKKCLFLQRKNTIVKIWEQYGKSVFCNVHN